MPQTLSLEKLEPILDLDGPLGAALYAVIPYESLARELERVGASLKRNFEGAAAGNRTVVAGLADLRNGVIPPELEEAAGERFIAEVRRLSARLTGALNEFANAKALAAAITAPEVGEKVAGIAAVKAQLDAFLDSVTVEPEPDTDDKDGASR
jgi:hypothetical protein